MALWIQNITPPDGMRGAVHQYKVAINNNPPLATFEHRRSLGAAECLRAAADAIEAVRDHPLKGTDDE